MILEFKGIDKFREYFKDEETCLATFEKIRFKDGEYCPHCKYKEIYRFTDGKRFKCKSCKKQFTIKVGTIFEGSKISLYKWFFAFHLLSTHKKGISSIQLASDLGVTQKTAWFMAHRIRTIANLGDNEVFTETVEIDETYVGGKEANKHKNKKTPKTQGRSLKTKAPILGMVSRSNPKKVKAIHVEHVQSSIIKKFVKANVSTDTMIYTDEFRNYNILNKTYKHEVINHNAKEFARGSVSTNSIENFWSIFKRGYFGIYHYMSHKHLQMYINEFVFRYNNKENLLVTLLELSSLRTITYKELTANV